jgi:uncharacterized protein (DUF885 family)
MESAKRKGHSASSAPEGTSPSSSAASSIEQASKRYREGIENYVRALQDAQVNISRPLHEAYKASLESMQALQNDIQRRLGELGSNTEKSIRDALSQPDAQTRYLDIQRQYTSALIQLFEEYQKRAEDANRQVMTALEQTQKEGQNALRDAFRDYLRSVQEAWAQLDVNGLAGRS